MSRMRRAWRRRLKPSNLPWPPVLRRSRGGHPTRTSVSSGSDNANLYLSHGLSSVTIQGRGLTRWGFTPCTPPGEKLLTGVLLCDSVPLPSRAARICIDKEIRTETMNRVDSPPLKNQKSPSDSRAVSGTPDRSNSRHYVQFYESDAFLVSRVAEFIAAAFETDGAAVLIATPEHRSAVEQQLSDKGLSPTELTEAGRYFSIDAKEMLITR